MKRPESICIFGDSTTWGAWDLEKGGWVNRLWLYVGNQADDYVEICNLSISGGTTETILARFENEAKVRKADALIFQTGGNDSAGVNEPGNYQISPEQFKKNLEEIISRAKNITQNIIFIGFKNVDESRTMPVSWGPWYVSNVAIKKYNQIMSDVCQEKGILFFDLFGLLENSDLEDGAHPNASGHQKIFIKVKDFLNENKWI